MRLYEVVYILDPVLDESAVTTKLEKFHDLATAQGGEVSAIDHWGSRQLAYPINKQETGYYVVAHFTAVAEALPEYERLLKLDDEVMRYLLVLNEGELTSGLSIVAESTKPPSDDDDYDREVVAAPVVEVKAEAAAGAEGDAAGEAEGDADGEAAEVRPVSDAPPEFQGAGGRRQRMEGPPITLLNYKDVSTLSRFLTEQGKILPKRTTKVTAGFQRQLGSAVKRARFLALLPYTRSHGA